MNVQSVRSTSRAWIGISSTTSTASSARTSSAVSNSPLITTVATSLSNIVRSISAILASAPLSSQRD